MSTLRLLYVACTSYSGSTLLSFLLNTHPQMFTVGHMTGWWFENEDDFHCSCGKTLSVCPFYAAIAERFRRDGLPFDIRDFGTNYRLVGNERLNRYLTEGLPRLENTALENLRDRLVGLIPAAARRFAQADRANRCFIEAALDYARADVFVDNSHSPYRLRHLRRIRDLDIRIVHLTRDFRGVALSNMKLHGWDPALATRIWLRRQRDIARIAGEQGTPMLVHFEGLCDDTDARLADIHRLAGLAPRPLPSDFKASEHHILGHKMREGSSTIRKDEKWRSELSARDRAIIERTASQHAARAPASPVARIVHYYLNRAE